MAAAEIEGSVAQRRGGLRHLFVALSLANLIFYPVWQEALHYANEYYYDAPAADRAILAAALDVLLLTAVLWAGSHLAGRSEGSLLHRLARAAFLAALLIPLNHVRTNLDEALAGGPVGLAGKAAIVLAALGILAGIWLTLRGSERPSRAAQIALLIFLPYAVMTFGQGAWVVLGGRDSLYEPTALAEPATSTTAAERPRVLWIIFDQLDQELTFETRPDDVSLPAFDALRQESFAADQAYAPAGWTIVSIPALLTGRLVARAEPSSANSLWLRFADQDEPERWGRQPNVFSRARERQLDAALVGNYHPYCRILSGDLASCYSVSYRQGVPEPCGSVPCEGVRHVVGLVYRLPLMDRLPVIRRGYQAWNEAPADDEARAGALRYETIHARALALAADPEIDLVFAHYPVPHGPNVFNRRADRFLRPGETADRFDNMVLADHALAELRSTLVRSGLWERTAVIVSADHGEKDMPALALDAQGNRIDRRVPFIVKLPFRTAPVRYGQEMNTIVTQDLVLALLDGGIVDEAELSRWIEEHSTFGKSPVFPGNSG